MTRTLGASEASNSIVANTFANPRCLPTFINICSHIQMKGDIKLHAQKNVGRVVQSVTHPVSPLAIHHAGLTSFLVPGESSDVSIMKILLGGRDYRDNHVRCTDFLQNQLSICTGSQHSLLRSL